MRSSQEAGLPATSCSVPSSLRRSAGLPPRCALGSGACGAATHVTVFPATPLGPVVEAEGRTRGPSCAWGGAAASDSS